MRYRDDGKLAEFLTATRRLHLLTPPFGTTWHYYEVVNRIETRFNEGTYHHFREPQKVHVSNKVLQMTVLEMGIKVRAKPWRHVAPQPHYRSASGWLLRRLEMVCNTCRSVAWLVPQVTVAKIASSNAV